MNIIWCPDCRQVIDVIPDFPETGKIERNVSSLCCKHCLDKRFMQDEMRKLYFDIKNLEVRLDKLQNSNQKLSTIIKT